MNSLRTLLASLVVKKRFRLSPRSWEDVKPHFSQFGEDVALEMFLGNKRNGFYVDVGAFHPVALSNTYDLYARLNWRGINVEPNSENIDLFKKLRPRDINVNAAIGSAEGYCNYYRFETATFNTISQTQADQLKKQGLPCVAQKIRVLPLAKMLAERLPAGQDIDLMSIDCEGNDMEVLASNDWNKYRPQLVLVEDHSEEMVTPVVNYMKNVGYKMVNWVGLTRMFKNKTT